MYLVGWPGWKIAGRMGAPLYIRLEVLNDSEAGVYIVTSRDLPGLVAEVSQSATPEEMHRAIDDCASLLIQERMKKPTRTRTATVWPGEFAAT